MFYRRFRNTFIISQRSLLFARTSRQADSAKLTALSSIALLMVVVAAIVSSVATTRAQEDKPQGNSTKPSASPSPKLGTELNGPVIVNTDLITLTVTVTDTYGRYVSGLNKNAFTVLRRSSLRRLHTLATMMRRFRWELFLMCQAL